MTNEDRLKILQAARDSTTETIQKAEDFIRDVGSAYEGRPPAHLDKMISSMLKNMEKLRADVAAVDNEIASIKNSLPQQPRSKS